MTCIDCLIALPDLPDDEYLSTDLGGEPTFVQVRTCPGCGTVNETTDHRSAFA